MIANEDKFRRENKNIDNVYSINTQNVAKVILREANIWSKTPTKKSFKSKIF